jgi:hypothetical protein
MHVARNGGGKPAVLALPGAGRDLPELPAMIESNNLIPQQTCIRNRNHFGLRPRHLSSHANNRAQQDAANSPTGTCNSHPSPPGLPLDRLTGQERQFMKRIMGR